MSTQIQIRRDTSSNWNSVDPVLAEGELGYDLTSSQFKVGDGVSAWSALPFGGPEAPEAPDLSAYATETWVSTNYQVKGDYLVSADLGGYATEVYVDEAIAAIPEPPDVNLDGYATETWVSAGYQVKGNYLVSADLNGYATEAWVNGKNYSTYTGADAVKTSGTQTVNGAKTFGSNVTAPDFVATSDERVKDNISTAPVGLIDSLKGREWDWKESGEKGSGVVAQELEQVLPHLVHEDGDGMKSVAYNGLIAYLIEEIKDLKTQVDALKNG